MADDIREELTPIPFEELFWGGYLTALYRSGAVTSQTPEAEIWEMKAEFLHGIRGGTTSTACSEENS